MSPRPLAFLVFVSSCVSAYCLALMSYTLATGELPFDLQPLMPEPGAETTADTAAGAPPDDGELRAHEETATRLFREIEAERQRLDREAEELAERRRVVEELADNARKLQDAVDANLAEVRSLLVQVDSREKENLRGLATLIGNLPPEPGATMILAMEEPMAVRMLYYMEQKQSGAIIGTMLQDPRRAKRAAQLVEAMHRLDDR